MDEKFCEDAIKCYGELVRGKAIAGRKVIFTVNGKTYIAKTIKRVLQQ